MAPDLTLGAPARTQEAAEIYVRATGLSKRYGTFAAVSDLSIEVQRGDTLALLGPSGCGKTTILRCIAGLEQPNGGRIEIGGQPVFDAIRGLDLMPEQRGLGIVFQSYAIWPHLDVAANVGFPLKVRHVDRRRIAEQVDEILALVGLSAWRDRPATALSGGQQQRVALARALVHRPQLVLFDEPMSNLDAQLREQMRIELQLLQQRLGFTAIYVTHDQAEAFALARHIAVLDRGHIEQFGTPHEVFNRPASPFVARFLGYNLVAGRVVESEGAGRRVTVSLPGGLHLVGCSIASERLESGAQAIVCLRKEQVRLAPVQDSGRVDLQRLPCEIRAVSFQGLNEEYVLSLAGIELHASVPACGLAPGPAVLALAEEDCLVLPEARESIADSTADCLASPVKGERS